MRRGGAPLRRGVPIPARGGALPAALFTALGFLAVLLLVARPVEAQGPSVEPAPESGAPPPAIVVEGGEQVVRPPAQGEAAPPLLSDRFGAGARTVIPRAKFADTARTVADVLEEVPGVALTRSGDGLSPTRVSIRGSRSDQVLILLDGAPLAAPGDAPAQRRREGGAGLDLAAIPLAQVESIEVIRGAASALYGPGAAAGAILIRTRAPARPALELAGTVGSGGYGEEDLLWHRPLAGEGTEARAFSLHLNHRRSAGTYVFYDPEAAQAAATVPADPNACAVPLGEGYFERRCNETRVATVEAALVQGAERRLGLLLEDYRRDGLGGVEDPRPFGREQRRRLRLAYRDRHPLSDPAADGEGPAYLGWSARLERLDSERLENATLPAAPRAGFTDDQGAGELWWEGWSGPRQVRLGGALEREVLRDMAFRAARTTPSAFAGWALHREAGTLEANLRHDAPAGLGGRTTGRAAASQALAGGLGVKASLATGYRPPTLYELFDPGALPGTSVANPDLQPETSVSSDGGLYVQAGEAFYAEALAFRQETRQTIVALPAPSSPNLFRFENVNRTRSTGVEAALNARLPLGFSLDLAWTRTDAVILDNDAVDLRDNGNRVPGVPRERWNASAAWRQGGWHAWLQSRHSGRRYVDTANTRFLQPYTLFDAGLNVPLGRGFEAGVEGRNLTNVTYAELDNHPPPGRQGFLTLRWKWGGPDGRSGE